MPDWNDPLHALAAGWMALREALLHPHVDPAALDALLRAARTRQPLPVIWLVGRAQSGKTSIVRALTGSPDADIGNGYRACTRTARLYDYPPQAPLVRFLDTRGLGEVAYDPAEDIAFCERQAHLLLGVMRALEPPAGPVTAALAEVRRRHPEWPLVVAQTCLHEAYPPGGGHLLPYPYAAEPLPEAVPAELRRALAAQRAALARLPGALAPRCVALDLTLAEDGYAPPDYGLEALWAAIEAVLPHGLRATLGTDAGVQDLFARSAEPHLRGYALAAAALGALPAAGAVGVPALQAKLLHSLAALYGLTLDARLAGEFLAALGLGIGAGYLARYAGRELAKLVPGFGQTVGALWGASASGAGTYALGRAACAYFAALRGGAQVDVEAVRRAYGEGLTRAVALLQPADGARR
ncbi:uncharacterized protein (DUF697 family) [Plasticicumulans lactativorans]|uniref:Uncharacterized protein (DUF697 family) n=1 Tax=Plasticicumulans lactativorans TaxID=1133106 RepID=A0A4R2L3A3_9GAMM|nr:GTPase [Plasticicumulans lactativorans]TCO79707.1 uncharacterized protein (DUF697 family) [Plasticicumulans lactativorans]